MTDSVSAAIGIDRVDMCGKTTLIEEQHGSDANFILNSIVSTSLEKGQGICLVLFHNTFGHYHNVGMKLGYNMRLLKERGQVSLIEPMKFAYQNVQDIDNDSTYSTKTNSGNIQSDDIDRIPDIMKLDKNFVQDYFLPVKNRVNDILKSIGSVNLIVDDLSHLFDIGFSLRDVWSYVRYLKSLMEFDKRISISIMTHTYKADPDSCQPDMIAVGLRHMADLTVRVEPLSTGHANDVSGKLNISWKVDEVRRNFHWAEKISYFYKLLDRQVKIFPPGASILY